MFESTAAIARCRHPTIGLTDPRGMSGRFSQQFLDDVLSRVDIVDLVDSRIPLKRSGDNYKACCPFHTERTPSFNVSRSKQFFHCFGCGAHGNAIDFLRAFENLDFTEAVLQLAASVGIEPPGHGATLPSPQENRIARQLYDLQADVARFYARQLRTHPEARRAVAYLKQRGITGEIARRYGLGYAPPGWRSLPAQFDPEVLRAAGLVISKPSWQYDRFRDRIMFPIRDRRGRVVGFGGRVLDDAEPKYLNSPETPVFKKHEQVYGLFEALQSTPKSERLLVVEGYLDVIALAQCGFPNAVATLGTATSPGHIHLLFRFTDEIVFCFDGDEAGHKAAWKALQNVLPALPEGRVVRFLTLPQGEDPDSLVRKEGGDAFRERLAASQLLSDYFFAELSRNLAMDSIEGRTTLINRAAPLLQTLKPGPFRQMMRSRLAEFMRGPATIRPESGRADKRRAPSTPLRPSAHQRLLMLLMQNPNLAGQIDESTRGSLMADKSFGTLFERLFGLLHEDPRLAPEQIRTSFRGSPQETLVDGLCAADCPMPPEALEMEFRHTVARIGRQFRDRRLDELIRRAKLGPLDAEERDEMRRLTGKNRDRD